MKRTSLAEEAAETISRGIGRRRFVQAVAALSAGAGVASCASPTGAGNGASANAGEILQPGGGPMPGDHYLGSPPDQVLWGYVPTVHAQSALQMRSGQTVTIDTVSHEGILEDQGRDPVTYFAGHGVAEGDVLKDAVDIAAGYRAHPTRFRRRRTPYRHRPHLHVTDIENREDREPTAPAGCEAARGNGVGP